MNCQSYRVKYIYANGLLFLGKDCQKNKSHVIFLLAGLYWIFCPAHFFLSFFLFLFFFCSLHFFPSIAFFPFLSFYVFLSLISSLSLGNGKSGPRAYFFCPRAGVDTDPRNIVSVSKLGVNANPTL